MAAHQVMQVGDVVGPDVGFGPVGGVEVLGAGEQVRRPVRFQGRGQGNEPVALEGGALLVSERR